MSANDNDAFGNVSKATMIGDALSSASRETAYDYAGLKSTVTQALGTSEERATGLPCHNCTSDNVRDE